MTNLTTPSLNTSKLRLCGRFNYSRVYKFTAFIIMCLRNDIDRTLQSTTVLYYYYEMLSTIFAVAVWPANRHKRLLKNHIPLGIFVRK